MITLKTERIAPLFCGLDRICGLAVVLAACAGCFPATIQGTVENLQGDRLPGVVVEVRETGHQALTNARGEYEVRYEPGEINLRFMKTGYTGGRLEMTIDEYRPVLARPVTLWPLPRQKGVHFLEEYRYRAAGVIEPERFESNNLGTVWGLERWTDVQVGPEPYIVAHRLPRNALRVYRMEMVELFVEDDWGDTQIVEVYTGARLMPHEAHYIDEAGTLLAIDFPEGLPPGNYGVSWGALQGETNIDSRIWIFSVLPSEPEPAEEDEEDEEEEEDGDNVGEG